MSISELYQATVRGIVEKSDADYAKVHFSNRPLYPWGLALTWAKSGSAQ